MLERGSAGLRACVRVSVSALAHLDTGNVFEKLHEVFFVALKSNSLLSQVDNQSRYPPN